MGNRACHCFLGEGENAEPAAVVAPTTACPTSEIGCAEGNPAPPKATAAIETHVAPQKVETHIAAEDTDQPRSPQLAKTVPEAAYDGEAVQKAAEKPKVPAKDSEVSSAVSTTIDEKASASTDAKITASTEITVGTESITTEMSTEASAAPSLAKPQEASATEMSIAPDAISSKASAEPLPCEGSAKPSKASSSSSLVAGASQKENNPTSEDEQRVDPADGKSYTFQQMSRFYANTYSKPQIKEYWNSCKPLQEGAEDGQTSTEKKPKKKARGKKK